MIAGRHKNFAAFLRDTTVTEEEIHAMALAGNYKAVKHPNTGIHTILEVANSPVWYKRLAALCTKRYRKQMFEKASNDVKSTVRAAAYKGALWVDGEPYFSHGWLSPDEVKALVIRDPGVYKYFRGWIRDAEDKRSFAEVERDWDAEISSS